MLVNQVLSKIQELKSAGELNNQTVEFVIDTQKYYVKDLKAGTDTCAFEVTRKSFRPLSVGDFENALGQAGKDLETTVVNIDKNTELKIEGLFASHNFLEVITDPPAAE